MADNKPYSWLDTVAPMPSGLGEITPSTTPTQPQEPVASAEPQGEPFNPEDVAEVLQPATQPEGEQLNTSNIAEVLPPSLAGFKTLSMKDLDDQKIEPVNYFIDNKEAFVADPAAFEKLKQYYKYKREKPLLRMPGSVGEALSETGDVDRKSTRLNSSHVSESRMPSSA